MRQNFVGDDTDIIYDVITFILRRPGVAIFAGIIKISMIFFIAIYKDSRKVKL